MAFSIGTTPASAFAKPMPVLVWFLLLLAFSPILRFPHPLVYHLFAELSRSSAGDVQREQNFQKKPDKKRHSQKKVQSKFRSGDIHTQRGKNKNFPFTRACFSTVFSFSLSPFFQHAFPPPRSAKRSVFLRTCCRSKRNHAQFKEKKESVLTEHIGGSIAPPPPVPGGSVSFPVVRLPTILSYHPA